MDDGTLNERIASVAGRAQALGSMADHTANGVRTAGVRTRVLALLVDAGQVTGTLAVADTLRSTVGRYPEEVRQTGARRTRPRDLALRVRTAGRRYTWVLRSSLHWRSFGCASRGKKEREKRILNKEKFNRLAKYSKRHGDLMAYVLVYI